MQGRGRDTVELILYGIDMPDGGCVQVWPNWPHPLPQEGDAIKLHDGHWEVVYREFNPSEDHVDVYARPPPCARGKS